MTSNNSFKPNLLRYTKAMAVKACHGFGSTTQVGLTQALGRSGELRMSSRAISAVIAVCLAGCSSMAVDQALDLGTVVSGPARYDGQQIVVAACISVVIHGVALLPCGERAPYVAIDEPDTGRSKFSQLVSYAHKNMGAYPEELPVLVGGEFRAIGMNGREISSISVERFQPHQGY